MIDDPEDKPFFLRSKIITKSPEDNDSEENLLDSQISGLNDKKSGFEAADNSSKVESHDLSSD